MTRTERSNYPRAIVRDRSESKSGLDKSIRKHGAGPHNWGNIADEKYLEAAGLDDEERELAEVTGKPEVKKRPDLERKTSSFTEEEREDAIKFRKGALKGQDIDLSAIARTSAAVSTSPPSRAPVVVVGGADTNALEDS
ncbi:hypothetical protein BJ138DRAFT_1151831 [Hygrophoropsis aurantiaca]|uniref:Uncharacterized protein n=1 Tax=Hygrophoropsis aurantiaca TaxID=72124 RepID=A0ACB8ACP1_9AGAM|nr:hypothetical protein BJ138DRAFT_1151831 [Hygrophoropsis aurantiaca]